MKRKKKRLTLAELAHWQEHHGKSIPATGDLNAWWEAFKKEIPADILEELHEMGRMRFPDAMERKKAI